MATADRYFKNRQATRAYQKDPANPLEAGGPAVGGLTESTRYNRQQVGASYLSAPTGTGSWTSAPGSRGMGRGGYVSMPTDGPTPTGGAPDRPQRMGPAGPSVMAQGVAGRFDRPSENTFRVTGAADKTAATIISGAAGLYGAYRQNKALSERARKKEIRRLEQLGPDRPESTPFEETVTLGKKKVKPQLALPAAPTPFDPQAKQVSMTESMGRSQYGPQREPTGSPIAMGPVIETTATVRKPPAGRTQSREWLADPERARQAASRFNIPLIWR